MEVLEDSVEAASSTIDEAIELIKWMSRGAPRAQVRLALGAVTASADYCGDFNHTESHCLLHVFFF